MSSLQETTATRSRSLTTLCDPIHYERRGRPPGIEPGLASARLVQLNQVDVGRRLMKKNRKLLRGCARAAAAFKLHPCIFDRELL